MATEYRLSYTATEIDERLGRIDNLAEKSEIPAKTSDLTNDSGFLTSIPSEYVTETELNDKGYLTEHQDLSGYALKAEVPTKVSDLTNDSGFITGYIETDPTVPAWAKVANKPTYTASEVGLGNVDNVKQYSAENPPVVFQSEAPTDTSVLWVDTDDDYDDGFQEAVNLALAQAKASGEFDGAKGDTPVKGTDYFTDADKAEMVNAVIAALPVYNGEVV